MLTQTKDDAVPVVVAISLAGAGHVMFNAAPFEILKQPEQVGGFVCGRIVGYRFDSLSPLPAGPIFARSVNVLAI